MKITIVGAGPVGLLLACLLAKKHRVTVLEKRTIFNRHHVLSLDPDTIALVATELNVAITPTITTSDLQTVLLQAATTAGVITRFGVDIQSLQDIPDTIVIGADGAQSRIRQFMDVERVDIHTVQYMAQIKFTVPRWTRPRSKILSAAHTMLNGLTGDDLVTTFESMAPLTTDLVRSATLHIPIPSELFQTLSADGRGTFTTPWTVAELEARADSSTAKFLRIIHRYQLGLTWRQSQMCDERITVLPLTMYRSDHVFASVSHPVPKLLLLCGDASSGLIYQRGCNKGWLEALHLAHILCDTAVAHILDQLPEYTAYCRTLYETERDAARRKGLSISFAHTAAAMTSRAAVTGLVAGLVSSSSR